MESSFLKLNNPGSAPMNTLPCLPFPEFRRTVIDAIRNNGWHVSSFFAMPEQNDGFRLITILTDDSDPSIRLSSTRVEKS